MLVAIAFVATVVVIDAAVPAFVTVKVVRAFVYYVAFVAVDGSLLVAVAFVATVVVIDAAVPNFVTVTVVRAFVAVDDSLLVAVAVVVDVVVVVTAITSSCCYQFVACTLISLVTVCVSFPC